MPVICLQLKCNILQNQLNLSIIHFWNYNCLQWMFSFIGSYRISTVLNSHRPVDIISQNTLFHLSDSSLLPRFNTVPGTRRWEKYGWGSPHPSQAEPAQWNTGRAPPTMSPILYVRPLACVFITWAEAQWLIHRAVRLIKHTDVISGPITESLPTSFPVSHFCLQ